VPKEGSRRAFLSVAKEEEGHPWSGGTNDPCPKRAVGGILDLWLGRRRWHSRSVFREEEKALHSTRDCFYVSQPHREVVFRLEAKILMMFGFPLFFLGPLSFYPQPYPLLSTLLDIIPLH
jgi:hypothetical protein